MTAQRLWLGAKGQRDYGRDRAQRLGATFRLGERRSVVFDVADVERVLVGKRLRLGREGRELLDGGVVLRERAGALRPGRLCGRKIDAADPSVSAARKPMRYVVRILAICVSLEPSRQPLRGV